ncbi:MAG: DNA-binding protein [Candidatus Thermoplasmatota archaeon]|jgi:rRNA-processing protein FCF1|nr:DNA-binding protein [Candidatus Thermoplasmatota archaeon]
MASDRLWGDRIHKVVILDSSAIMMLFEFSIDLENELTRLLGSHAVVVPKAVVDELDFLAKKEQAGKKKMKAKAAIKLIEKYEIVDVKSENADDSIIELAKETDGVVVTNDTELRKRLKELSVPIIFLRAKKKLVME